MAVFGQGILPASGAVANELSAVTRRGFIAKMIVQIYNASPVVAALMANANLASGGVSPITIPIQGSPYVKAQSAGYGGNFTTPASLTGAQNAEFNLKLFIVPVPFLGVEGLVQVNHAVIPLIEARMNDAGNALVEYLTLNAYNNSYQGTTTAAPANSGSGSTATNTTADLSGLPAAISSSNPTGTTYGNVDRNVSTFWQAYQKAAGSVDLTRALTLQHYMGLVKNCGEAPTFAVTGPGTWLKLANDYLGLERYSVEPSRALDTDTDGPRSAFRALMVAGLPVYADPYATEGTLWLFNENYGGLYFHESAAFYFTGFESLIPNSTIGYLGAVVSLAELVIAKPKAFGQVTGLNSITL
jgi:hypothetical protein